ncbi:MAG TPA: hypothetical protein VFK89_12440 [Actinomycetota bacterium]|nr:hypothetical protein [Actinomycetota bacterium]
MESPEDPEMRDQDGGFDDDPSADPGEQLEAMIEHADRPFATESYGTTAEEETRGESLDQKLAEERPERQTVDSAYVIEDADAPDEEAELVGDAALERDPFLSPEEAAVHIEDESGHRES